MARTARQLIIAKASFNVREETWNGEAYLVVPVVALVEGVVHAMNAPNPELVTAEEFTYAPQGWNGRPVYHNHPLVDGRPVSGNDPSVLEAQAIGIVFHSGITKNKLTMEAWVNEKRAEQLAPELLERIKDADEIEISVGVFAETDDESGEYNGKKYAGAWHDLVPDHLALLDATSTGACSREMGCGVRAAAAKKGDAMERQGRVGQAISRFMQMFRVAQPPEEMSDNDVRRKLYDALRQKYGTSVAWVEAVYDDLVVYYTYTDTLDYSGKYFETSYSLSEEGVVTLGEETTHVEPVLYYEPMAGAEPRAAAGASACSCGGGKAPTAATSTNTEEITMEKKERVANLIKGLPAMFTDADASFLGSDTEEQLTRLESQVAAPAAEVTEPVVPVEEPVAEQPIAAAAPKPQTAEEYLASAPAEVRETIESGLRVGRAKKEATIQTLKQSGRCDIPDAELKTMTQASLDRLVKLAGAPAEPVDFSGRGNARPSEGEDETVPAAPDLTASMRAARGVKA